MSIRRDHLDTSHSAQNTSRVRQLQKQARLWGSDAMGLLFPSRCAGCGRVDALLCRTCRASFLPVEAPVCQRCGRQDPTHDGFCQRCDAQEPLFASAQAIFQYEGHLREAIRVLKFEGRTELASLLAEEMLATLNDEFPNLAHNMGLDAVLAVPLHPDRMLERGFNQVEVLFEPLAVAWQVDWLPEAAALWRTRHTGTQVGLNLAERRQNVSAAFEADPARVAGLTLLLVDDIRTTGATTDACVEALLDAGAGAVHILTLAQTPLETT